MRITGIKEREYRPFTREMIRSIAEQEGMLPRQHALTCPKCSSKNTGKVVEEDSEWKVGLHRCLDCGHRADWGLFCTPPIHWPDHPLFVELRRQFEKADR